MHMADALLSPVVGGTMWGVTAVSITCCSRKVRTEMDDRKIPLMGVLGAFIFAAQMINFSIPVTGSSGHLGGGVMLSILLGPYAAFLTIASVLVIQAFFFADGGLLALGCNIFNLGFLPAFIAYPLVYRKIVGREASPAKISTASIAAAIIALQLGSFGVVLETVLSGISSLPFSTFVLIMQPIHLAIGAIEGIVTASIISFIYNARPEILQATIEDRSSTTDRMRGILVGLLVSALFMGGIFSWFASERPDGLEWSIAKTSGQQELRNPADWLHSTTATIQNKLALLPDYSFRRITETKPAEITATTATVRQNKAETRDSQDSRLGTSVSGIVGGFLTLGLALMIGFVLKRIKQTP